MNRLVWCLFLIGMLATASMVWSQGNPASPDFDVSGSDAAAVAIADEVMAAMGGHAAWNETRVVRWRFFGSRLHTWDKWTGDARIESEDGVLVMNVHDKTGRAWVDGVELEGDALAERLETGYAWWINDSYWVYMPYKLKDSGVTLTYVGEGTTADGRAADLLNLTFKEVGMTPQNRYEVAVDKETRLVSEWSYYEKADDAEPKFTMPWADWTKVGRILLPGSHGRGADWELAVFDEVPAGAFSPVVSTD